MAGTELQLDKTILLAIILKSMPTLKRNGEEGINYKIHTIGALLFHKDGAGSVISLKARHHRICTAWATY